MNMGYNITVQPANMGGRMGPLGNLRTTTRGDFPAGVYYQTSPANHGGANLDHRQS